MVRASASGATTNNKGGANKHPGHTMKLVNGHADSTSSVYFQARRALGDRRTLVRLFLGAGGGAGALFLLSMVLPGHLEQLALDLMSWCLVAALAALFLGVVVKVLDSLLDL
ncbi:MAG: hypothetical protein JWQ72_1505 [Polaromonas sp.]|nr:hypothetical protein [Polaromonas sp.]